MTKQEFLAQRQAQREAGLLEEYQPENFQNDLLENEEAILINALNGQKSGIYKTKDLGLTGLLCIETYVGKTIKCQRRRIDELDNITVWKI
jgi:hypothetical protein